MPLSPADEAQLIAVLGKPRGPHKLRAPVKASLLAFFRGREQTVPELPLDPEAMAEDEYEEVWSEFCSDAGLTAASDIGSVKRWAKAGAAAASGGGGGKHAARAGVVLDLLAERGIDVPDAVQSEVEGAMRAIGESGDALAQSCSSLAVVIMYMVELPGDEVEGAVGWHAARAKTLPKDGTIDLRTYPPYWKQLKNSSKVVLERALLDKDPTNRKLASVKRLITQHLFTAGLPLAATRFQDVTGWAAEHFRHAPAKEKEYLWGYFFITFLGRGLPELRDRDTLTDMTAPVPGSVSSVAAEMRPTIPGESSSKDLATDVAGLFPGSASSPAGPALPLGFDPGMYAPNPSPVGALPPNLAAMLLQQQALFQRLMGGEHRGEEADTPPIRELTPPKVSVRCPFCHQEHDPKDKCNAMKQALRLKADWDKAEATARKKAEADAKASGADASASGTHK